MEKQDTNKACYCSTEMMMRQHNCLWGLKDRSLMLKNRNDIRNTVYTIEIIIFYTK